jgi:DNA repair protein RadD
MHWFKVDRVEYNKVTRAFQRPEMSVRYSCGLRKFSELISIEHDGWAGKKARNWWRERLPGFEPPPTTEDGLTATAMLREPTHVYVHTNATWPRVTAYSYDGTTPTVANAKPSHEETPDGTDS